VAAAYEKDEEDEQQESPESFGDGLGPQQADRVSHDAIDKVTLFNHCGLSYVRSQIINARLRCWHDVSIDQTSINILLRIVKDVTHLSFFDGVHCRPGALWIDQVRICLFAPADHSINLSFLALRAGELRPPLEPVEAASLISAYEDGCLFLTAGLFGLVFWQAYEFDF
jgi:hypothetical protein